MGGGQVARRDRRDSLCVTIATVVLGLVVAVLDATHQKPEPIAAGDNAWVGKTLIGVSLTAVAFLGSVVSGIRCIALHRDFWPLAWLIPLAVACYLFLEFFDWPSVILQRVR